MINSINSKNFMRMRKNKNYVSSVNFKSDAAGLEKTPENDILEKNNSQKACPKNVKWVGGIALGLTTITGSVVLISKRQFNKIKKLYQDLIKQSNLPEKIKFEHAKSIDEGIKFAKEVLGIEKVDKNFTLEAINFVNKGLVDVCNANKGKVFLPKGLRYRNLGDDVVAQVHRTIKDSNFAELSINKKFFEREFLENRMNSYFSEITIPKNNEIAKNVTEKTQPERNIQLHIAWSEDFNKLINRFRNGEKLSIEEMRKSILTFEQSVKAKSSITKGNPLFFLKGMQQWFKEHGIIYKTEEISKLAREEQFAKLDSICEEFYKKYNCAVGLNEVYIPNKTIYHEMGHLQDYATNLERLDLQSTLYKKIINLFKFKKRQRIDGLNNHWARKDQEHVKKLIKEKPEFFQQTHPDLYEFINSPNIQHTAGEVSKYAQFGIGEFIAEVYAGLISGQKYSDDVMTLYKKYGGPILG